MDSQGGRNLRQQEARDGKLNKSLIT